MNIQFDNTLYTIPDPIQDEDEAIIQVEKLAIIPVPDSVKKDRFTFSHSLSKLWFFLMHEGVRLTFDKTWSSIFHKKVISERQIVFAFGKIKDSGHFAIAVGPQYCPYADCLLFPLALTLRIDEENTVDDYYQTVREYLGSNPETAEALYHYSKHSGNALPLCLKKIIDQTKPGHRAISVTDKTLQQAKFTAGRNEEGKKKKKTQKNRFHLFLAGGGAYATAYILPSLKNVNYHTVIDLNPILASVTGARYGFLHADTSYHRALDRLKESRDSLLVVATYHSTHLPIIEHALSNNPDTKIFLEKPPVTTENQLKKLLALRDDPRHFIEIGYNRRHSPFIREAKERMDSLSGPMTMICVVKELTIPTSHWYYWPDQGTRVTGNLCHWVDLGVHFIGKKPLSITAISASHKSCADEISISVLFEEGSLLTLVASDRGNQLAGVQEYIEIRRADLTIAIHDFMHMHIRQAGKQWIRRKMIRDKGHKRMYRDFINRCEKNQNPGYPNDDLFISTILYLTMKDVLVRKEKYFEFDRLTFESIRENEKVSGTLKGERKRNLPQGSREISSCSTNAIL
ncbi:MAG: hypothetical protein AB1847_12635 [bacterium]